MRKSELKKLRFGKVSSPSSAGAYMLALLASLLFLSASIGPASAAVNAQITGTNPPSGVVVEAGSVFPLMVGVTYSVPPDVAKKYGPYLLWLTVDGRSSNVIQFMGPGSYTFQFTVGAPSVEGVYTLKLSLYIATKMDYPKGQLRDTAVFTYRVKPKVVTDWEVEKVWITPSSPGPGDEVTFHARIALRKTTSTQSLTVEVMCYLDGKPFIKSPIALSFKPMPSTQEVTVPNRWTATEGEHELMFTVDQMKRHNDPTPYPRYNFMRFTFRVEPYYAVIHDIKAPRTVDPGETFEIVIGVDYKFPDNTRLKITNAFPSDTSGVEQFDTVSGDSIGSYVYSVEAPTVPFARPGELLTMPVNGSAQVEFDRGTGWQHTEPGWQMDYLIMVRRPTYYAVFESVEAAYLGTAGEGDGDGTRGRFSITMQVRYLLPLETGLRLIVRGLNGTSEVVRVEEAITQTESTEHTGTYTYEYTFPLTSLREGSYSITFEASVEYMVEGAWYHGDDGSAAASVSIIHPPVTEERVTRTILDDLIDWLNSFFDRIRRMFG